MMNHPQQHLLRSWCVPSTWRRQNHVLWDQASIMSWRTLAVIK